MADIEHKNDGLDGKSGGEMLAEVGRLLLQLGGRLLRLLLRLLLKGLKKLLKWFCKGLLLLIDAIILANERFQAFWNDNDTQEKVRKTKAWIIRAGKQLWAWTLIAGAATWRATVWLARNTVKGTIWLSKKTVQGIIHLGPTLRAIGRGLKWAGIAVWHGLRAVWRGLCKWAIGRKRAYRRFRRNKGFKGLLVDLSDWLKGQIRDYVEEEPMQQTTPEGVMEEDEDEDDPFKLLDERSGHSKVNTWGRSIYNAMKRIVED